MLPGSEDISFGKTVRNVLLGNWDSRMSSKQKNPLTAALSGVISLQE